MCFTNVYVRVKEWAMMLFPVLARSIVIYCQALVNRYSRYPCTDNSYCASFLFRDVPVKNLSTVRENAVRTKYSDIHRISRAFLHFPALFVVVVVTVPVVVIIKCYRYYYYYYYYFYSFFPFNLATCSHWTRIFQAIYIFIYKYIYI